MKSESLGKSFHSLSFNFQKSFKFHSISHNQSHNNQTNKHKYLFNITFQNLEFWDVTLLVTHKHESIVSVTRLNTRDELGFEMRWCCWRCWWRFPYPRWESCWWWWGRWFPLREGSSLGGIAPPEGKSAPAQVPPRDGGAPSLKSPRYIF